MFLIPNIAIRLLLQLNINCCLIVVLCPDHRKESTFESDYIVGSLLGSGGFGTVYTGVRQRDGAQVRFS